MKIVCVDNFNRETKNDRLVAETIKNDAEARVMLAALRNACPRGGDDWYEIKPDDYVLYRFDPV